MIRNPGRRIARTARPNSQLRTIIAALMFGLALPQPALAADPALTALQLARLDTIAQRTAMLSWCEKLGYSVNEERIPAITSAAIAELATANVPAELTRRNLTERGENQAQLMAERRKEALENMDSGASAKKQVAALASNYERVCGEAVKDPAFQSIISASPGETSKTRIQRFSDELLTPHGQASWQTPRMFAQAEVLFAVGTCQSYLAADRIKALTTVLVASATKANPRLLNYYNYWYAEGIKGAAEIALNEAQCAKVIARRSATLRAMK